MLTEQIIQKLCEMNCSKVNKKMDATNNSKDHVNSSITAKKDNCYIYLMYQNLNVLSVLWFYS